MTRPGRPMPACPDVDKLRSMVEAGCLQAELMRHFRKGGKTVKKRFQFCPTCGTPLTAFWYGVDDDRAAEKRRYESECADREMYRNTSPT